MEHAKSMKRNLILFTGVLLLIGCTAQPSVTPLSFTATPPPPNTAAPTETSSPGIIAQVTATATLAAISPTATQTTPAIPASSTPEPTLTASITPRPTLGPDEWQQLPVIPVVSDRVAQIYQQGIQLGNNPNAFSKIGDCGSTPAWFLGDFDRGPEFYNLGEYTHLEAVIENFGGSYGRTSLAARSGFNAASLFVSLWSDRNYCGANESPLACEYRTHLPIAAFIMLGTNDVWHPDEFEPQMRKIIEFSIESGVVPILSTKADNIEGDGSINDIIARLALEYDLPIWNFWLAVQPLPDHGMQEDQAHLTWGRNFFNDPVAMSKAWPVRNLTALQVLDAVWRKMSASN